MSGLNRDAQVFIDLINRNMRKAVAGNTAAQQQIKDCWAKLKRTPRNLWARIYDELSPQARAHLNLTLVDGRVVQANDDQWVPFRAQERSETPKPKFTGRRHDLRAKNSYQ